MAKRNSQVTWEVATLAGFRKRFKSFEAALEVFNSFACKVWLEEYHDNKLVKAQSQHLGGQYVAG